MGHAGNKLKKTVPNHEPHLGARKAEAQDRRTADPWLAGLMVNLTCHQGNLSLREAEVKLLPLMEETL